MKHKDFRSKRVLLSLALSIIGMSINYLITFLLTPFITKNLGIELYGFVSIANTFVNYAGVMTIALTSFMIRFISVAYHSGNIEEARRYFSSSVFCCYVASGIMLLLTMIICINLQHILVIPAEVADEVKLLFVLVFLTFIVNFIVTPFSSAFYIKDRLDISAAIKILSYIIQGASIFLFFFLFVPRLWYVGLGSLLSSFLVILLTYVCHKKLAPDLKFGLPYVSKEKARDLVKNGVWDSFNQLGNVLNSGLDLLIANLFLSAVATGQVSVAKTMVAMFAGLLSMVSVLFQPRLIKSYSSGNLDTFQEEITRAMRTCGFFSNLIFSGFFAMGVIYFKLWLPSEDSNVLYLLTLISFLNCVTDGIMRPVYYINTLTLKNRIPCFVTILGGVLNVAFMIVLVNFTTLGVYSIVITTAVIMVFINLVFNPIYAAKCVGCSCWYFYKNIIRNLVSCVFMSIVFWITAFFINPSSWFLLIVVALLMALEGFVIHSCVTNDANEIKKFFNMFFRSSSKKQF